MDTKEALLTARKGNPARRTEECKMTSNAETRFCHYRARGFSRFTARKLKALDEETADACRALDSASSALRKATTAEGKEHFSKEVEKAKSWYSNVLKKHLAIRSA